MDYAFTVKFTRKEMFNCVPSDYEPIFNDWEKRGLKIEIKRYELDAKGECHVHGIVNVPAKFYIKQLKRDGLHYKLDPLTDRHGWINYINKAYNSRKFTITKVNSTQDCSTPDDGLAEYDSGPLSDDDSEIDCSEIIAQLRGPLF